MEPDMEAVKTSVQAISIIFIILICLTNGILIARQVRKPLFYEKVKLMTIISLSIGDVIFALFPLVVTARMAFASDFSFLTCRLLLSYTTYANYLIHFVHGIGLVVLCAEVLLRHKIPAKWNKTITALAVSSIPWILGLVIILPLCMSNVEYDYPCRNRQYIDSMYGLSVLFPASLAVVVTAILNCVPLSTNQQDQSENTNQQAVVYSQENVGLPLIYTPQYNPQINKPDSMYPINQLLNVNSQENYMLPLTNQKSNFDSHQESSTYPLDITENKYHVLNFPMKSNQNELNNTSNSPPYNQPLAQNTTNHEGINVYNYNQQGVTQPTVAVNVPNNEATLLMITLPSNRHTEIQRLLVISILFFILVVPRAAILVSESEIIWPDSMTVTVVGYFIYWLMVTRSCITPLIMLTYSNL